MKLAALLQVGQAASRWVVGGGSPPDGSNRGRRQSGGWWVELCRRTLAIVGLWFSVVPFLIEYRGRLVFGDVVRRLIAFAAVVIIIGNTIQHGA